MVEELLDIVNEKDEIVGTMMRSEVYHKGLNCFRVVNAFLCDSFGRIWIPRRSPEKSLFPLCLDMSMGGHVSSGETYNQAMKREVEEELGIEATKLDFKYLRKLTPHDHGTSAFMKVYLAITDREPDYNKSDFCESFWLTPKQIIKKINGGDKAKDDLIILIKYFFKDELN